MQHQDLLAWQRIQQYTVAATTAAWYLLVPQDPARVVLWMGVADGSNRQAVFTTDPGIPVTQGIYGAASGQGATVLFTHAQHGILTQLAWYVYAPSAAQISAIAVIQDRDPCEGGKSNVGELSSRMRVQSRQQSIGRGRNLFDTSSRTKPRPACPDFLAD